VPTVCAVPGEAGLAVQPPGEPEVRILGVPVRLRTRWDAFQSRCTMPPWVAAWTAPARVARRAAAWRAGG